MIEEINPISQVSEFHKTFGAPILENPDLPNKERYKLRIKLLKEELEELEDAIKNKDLVEISDAFCDLQYVLSGAILEFGLGDKFKELFDEVQRSNMSKACNSIEEAEKTKEKYLKEGVNVYYKEINKKFVIYRKKDDKILKSINYSKPNLNKILDL